nr:MAG TPA: hypothetical protein [Caudoviricetes sp.]
MSHLSRLYDVLFTIYSSFCVTSSLDKYISMLYYYIRNTTQ